MFTVTHMFGGCVQDVSFYASYADAAIAIASNQASYNYSTNNDPEWILIDPVEQRWHFFDNQEWSEES